MNAAQLQTLYGSNYFDANGLTTITWGTDGFGLSGFGNTSQVGWQGVAGYIVVSASQEDRIEEIDITQAAGFTAIVILLNDGKNVNIEVIDDTSINPPTINNNPLTFSSPFSASFNVLLVASKADAAKKREGFRTFTLKSFNAIVGAH